MACEVAGLDRLIQKPSLNVRVAIWATFGKTVVSALLITLLMGF